MKNRPSGKYCVLIPAYNPDQKLIDLIDSLDYASIESVVVVNDGSHAGCRALFDMVGERPRVTVLEHCVNLGKGAALRSGLNFLYLNMLEADRVVTADADGQHLSRDIAQVGNVSATDSGGALVLGVRSFGRGVPLRSMLGNIITRQLTRLFAGLKVTDTQTGLRSIPKAFIPGLMRIRSNGYEFELDMLLKTKKVGLPIIEIGIQTVYIDGNRSSHFNPLLDSLRIYFTLLRYGLSSIATACIDFFVFLVVLHIDGNLLFAQFVARTVAGSFQFACNRNLVFRATGSVPLAAAKYILLVYAMGLVSHGLIVLISQNLPVPLVAAKVLAEVLLFPCTFAIQRAFVFTQEETWKNK